jgi:hypothetical protein
LCGDCIFSEKITLTKIRIYVSGRLRDDDSEGHNHFAGSPPVFPEIGGVNIKTAIFLDRFRDFSGSLTSKMNRRCIVLL